MIHTLETASIGSPITRSGVSLFPVYVHQHRPEIATGASDGISIAECPDAHVPSLQVSNTTGRPVLLVEGETVIGGLQNRVLNVSVLVPAGAVLHIPVSCVEQGRWGGGADFGRGRTFAPRRVRREKARGVAASVRETGAKYSDQHGVWNAVHAELVRLDAGNESGSLAGTERVFDRDRRIGAAVGELVAIGPLAGQCGVVVAHGSRVVAADVFAAPDMFACHWEAVVRSHLLDAPGEVRTEPSATRALRFLHKFALAEARVAPGVGLGREHHVANNRVVGQALVWDDLLVHASLFAVAA